MGQIRGKVSRMSPLTRQILKHKQERRRGLAQLPYPEKVRINNEYVKNRGFFLDLKIIIYTIRMHPV